MYTKEPPSIQKATSGQPQQKIAQDASARVGSTIVDTSTTEEQGKEKIGKKDTSVIRAQGQGTPPQIIIIDQGRTGDDKEEIPKEKEQEAIQTLINLSTIGTPTGTTQ